MLEKDDIDQLVLLRRNLHQYPELSGDEKKTSELIRGFLKPQQPEEIIENVGGYGLMAVFDSHQPGPTICFRCDLDALPIQEKNDFEHQSKNPGVAHKCGHDGHMTMVSGLAMLFGKNRPRKGKVVLLYQPSEETGEGAARVIADEKFKKIRPDYIIGLHNLPGVREGTIVYRENVFAAASVGMEIKLKGATAHAAEPEKGKSPAMAMAEIIRDIEKLPFSSDYNSFVLATVINAQLGKIAYGTTPGYAEVRATLRAYSDDDLEKLSRKAEMIVKENCHAYNLEFEISYTEKFPATESSEELVKLLVNILTQEGIDNQYATEPFRWSEDFGHFKLVAPTLFFGIGAGNIPNLHNYDYDFPDQIIPDGINLFYLLSRTLLT